MQLIFLCIDFAENTWNVGRTTNLMKPLCDLCNDVVLLSHCQRFNIDNNDHFVKSNQLNKTKKKLICTHQRRNRNTQLFLFIPLLRSHLCHKNKQDNHRKRHCLNKKFFQNQFSPVTAQEFELFDYVFISKFQEIQSNYHFLANSKGFAGLEMSLQCRIVFSNISEDPSKFIQSLVLMMKVLSSKFCRELYETCPFSRSRSFNLHSVFEFFQRLKMKRPESIIYFK